MVAPLQEKVTKAFAGHLTLDNLCGMVTLATKERECSNDHYRLGWFTASEAWLIFSG
jgi:hypothetical protein